MEYNRKQWKTVANGIENLFTPRSGIKILCFQSSSPGIFLQSFIIVDFHERKSYVWVKKVIFGLKKGHHILPIKPPGVFFQLPRKGVGVGYLVEGVGEYLKEGGGGILRR